jgi:hypothetical protein
VQDLSETNFEDAEQAEYGVPGVLLIGEIGCRGKIVIAVRKFLEILGGADDPDPMVETSLYSYQVVVRGVGRDKGSVFRWDNDHPYWLHPGHPDPHHKHLFDWRTGDELKDPPTYSPQWVGADDWPHLNEVIEQARNWYHANSAELPYPNGFPTLNRPR